MHHEPKRALIVIDVQNEYFDGAPPITDPPPDVSLANIARATDAAADADIPVIVVQHGDDDPESPIFRKGCRRGPVGLVHFDLFKQLRRQRRGAFPVR